MTQPQCDQSCHKCLASFTKDDPSVIRAVGYLYHRDCFLCDACQVPVLKKFYVLQFDDNVSTTSNDSLKDIILCENDYYYQCNYKCHQCHQSITNDHYRTINEYKYHMNCISCLGCSIVQNFGSTTSLPCQPHHSNTDYHGYNDRIYCRYHYSLIRGTECIGCNQTILDQHSELNNDRGGKWHPECYMIEKYWQVQLKDLPCFQVNYSNSHQLSLIQHDLSIRRSKIWNKLSHFEDVSSSIIANIILHHASTYKEKHQACTEFYTQITIICAVLDLLYEHSQKHLVDLPCDKPLKRLIDQMVALTDILCEQNRDSMDRLMKMATNLAQYIRDLVKQSLQHTVVIERKFGDSLMIDQLLLTFSKPDIKYKMKFECLNDQLQWVDMAIVRLHHPPSPSVGKKTDETINPFYKTPVTAPKSTQSSFFPLSQQQQNHSNNFCTAPATNHNHSLNIAANIKTSKSTPRQPHIYEPPPSSVNPSRMKTIRRALTTSRRKDKSPAASDTSSIRRDNRSHSLHNPSLTSLHITLPDIEQLNNYHTPPISPPSMSTNQYKWMMPAHLPELSPAQDSIIRHIAALYVETHVNDDFLLDDLLALLVDTKKPSSLWGKLKTHILTSQIHTPSDTSSLSYFTAINERKMGVSLSNLSYNDTHQVIPSSSFDTWASSCPSIKACFTQNTKVPHFFKECVLAIIAKDITMEGIFRKNGNIRGLKEMGDCLDSSQLHEWKTYCEEQTIIQLAAFIKRYLREMPEPLLTYKLHKLFLFSNSLHSPAESLLIIQYAICILPKANRDMLLLLLALLNWVARHSGKNKMDCHNLARVITPNIFYSATVKKQASARIADAWDCHGEIQVIAKMIEHYESLVKVPTDFTVILEHPKMTDYLCNSSVDLASSKQFIRIFDDLVKVKQEILSSSDPVYPPSPSHSATNNTITTLINAPSFTY